MSQNSKNAKRKVAERQRKRAKVDGATIVSLGANGPAKTTPKHGKVNRTKYNRADRAGPSVQKQAQE